MMERSFEQMWESLKQDSPKYNLELESAEIIVALINKVVKEREKKGLTQREVSEKCGIKQPALARIESLRTIPNLSTIIKIAKCVGLRVDAVDIDQSIKSKDNIENKSIIINIKYDFSNGESYEY